MPRRQRSPVAGLPPIAARLRQLRKQRGLNRRRCPGAGLTQPMIAMLESGRRGRRMSFGTLLALASALCVTVGDLTAHAAI